MITDSDIARACVATYDPALTPTWNTADVHAFKSAVGPVQLVSFRGSASPIDWVRDFAALPAHERFEHADLGMLHDGFADDVEEIFDQIVADLAWGELVAVGGHSKGAGEGQIFAALFRARFPERRLIRLTTFGSPRVGRLNGYLDGLAGFDFRNRNDPVCMVPHYFDRPRPLTPLDAPPAANDPLGIFADHRMVLYAKGVEQLAPAA